MDFLWFCRLPAQMFSAFQWLWQQQQKICEKSEEEQQGILTSQFVVILYLQKVKRFQGILVQVAFVLELSCMFCLYLGTTVKKMFSFLPPIQYEIFSN